MIRTILATLVAVTAATATDITVAVDHPNGWYQWTVSHHDRHAVGGAALGAGLYAGSALFTDSRPWRIADAVVGTAACAVSCELIEATSDRTALADPVDATWTVVGGAIGAVVADMTGQLFRIAPLPNGGALTIAWSF